VSVSGIGSFGVASAWSNALATKDKSAGALASLVATTTSGAATALSPAASASEGRVTLGAVVDTEVVYTKLRTSSFDVAWKSSPTDDTSALMRKNMQSNSSVFWDASSLLDGLGAQLLDRFSTTKSDFSQSVVSYLQNSSKSADVARAASTQALVASKVAPNRIGLTITTASGKEVSIAISFGGDGKAIANSLSVDVQVDGELTADEQKAVAQLSKGFQATLDGLSKVPPTVDLSGLVDYDASVLSGVELSVRETPHSGSELKSLDFRIDSTQRSFSMETVSGKISLSVDLSQPEIRGSAAQQSAALNRYLEQFDAANRRGHGDAKLIAQFKAAFSQLNSNYPAADELSVPLLSSKDRSVLSGLADFSASMSGDFTDAAEGRVTTEEGHIEYRASQSSTISGRDKYVGLTVSQTQRASLKTDYVKSRNGAQLDTGSGNYDRLSIRDESSTTTSFSYVKDKLKSASVERLVKQLETYAKLVDYKVVEERQTPRNDATRQDISAQLLPSYKEAKPRA